MKGNGITVVLNIKDFYTRLQQSSILVGIGIGVVAGIDAFIFQGRRSHTVSRLEIIPRVSDIVALFQIVGPVGLHQCHSIMLAIRRPPHLTGIPPHHVPIPTDFIVHMID